MTSNSCRRSIWSPSSDVSKAGAIRCVGRERSSSILCLDPGLRLEAGPNPLEHAESDLLRYVKLSTPGGGYYVGLDIQSALHPQTLLCYEMDGAPLTLGHGAPLRLVIPVKYGIKNIKRIGTIRFTDERPADYWAERATTGTPGTEGRPNRE